jgi:hypothetical protein
MAINVIQRVSRSHTGHVAASQAARCMLWQRPATPHAWDDEFDKNTLSTVWTRVGTWNDATAIDPYAGLTTGGTRWSLTRRSGWLLTQAQTNDTHFRRSVTFPTNLAMFWRCTFGHRIGSVPTQDSTTTIFWAADSGGAPDWNTFQYQNHRSYNQVSVDGGQCLGGGYTAFLTGNRQSYGQHIEYGWIQKRGTTYDHWIGSSQGQHVFLQETTGFTPTLIWIDFWLRNSSSAAPGSMITGIDFVRFQETASFWP